MKLFFAIIFFVLSLSNSFAQKEKDALLKNWHNIKLHDSTRFNAMIKLVENYYLYKKTDSAFVLCNKMLELAKHKKNTTYQIEAHTLLAQTYFEKEQNAKATQSYNQGLNLALKTKDTILYATKLKELGFLYVDYEEYTNAFNTLQKSQQLFKQLGDGLNEGWSVAYQGFIYATLGDYKEAEKYHLEHLRLSKKYNIKRSISGAYGNLGSVYNRMGDIQKSITYWKEGIRRSKEIGLPEYASVGTGNLINIYINQGQYAEAKKYLEEYKTVTKQFSTPKYSRNFLMDIHLWQCQIDYGLKKYAKALKECEDCLKIHNKNNWELDTDLLYSLYQINKKLNRNAKALAYFEKYQIEIDDKKENEARAEIQNIIFNNQLVSDSIAQAQEKELLNATYQEGLRKKNREKNLFLAIGILVLLTAIAYFIISKKYANKERKRLKEINQLKNALFTNITHEFRTPLTVIKGMTETLKTNFNNKQTENVENSLELIERNSNNLLHLVNEMLDLAKLESGNMTLDLVQSNVIPFLKYLCESFTSYAEDHNINLTIYAEIDELIMDFDGNKLTSVVSNLISNAIKFTPEHGKIIVHINQVFQNKQPYLCIKVKDTGIGISKDKLFTIFNRFYQADATTKRAHEGTGIGLALTKELVDLMHGKIKVESKVNKGSEFCITIPVTTNAKKVNTITSNPLITVPKANITTNQIEQTPETDSQLPLVLIIEDNLDVAHYLKTCLTNTHKTIHAVNGQQGIDMALEAIPDVIICDVMMPKKDGFEVCKTLKTDNRTDHIPIIILTAKATTDDRLKGLSCGADAYLAKPFNKEELFTRLNQLVALRKTLIEKIEDDGFFNILKKRKKDPKLQFVQKAVKLIHQDISNSNFGSEDLAKKLFISESQLYRKLKAITEKSTAVFIRSVRLQHAKDLLATSDKTISEIAYEVGFNNPSWFSRAFKDEFGHSPSAISSHLK